MHNDLQYKQFIRQTGLKATPGRIRLLAYLSNCRKPVSIKEIGKAVGSKSLDQATIYRILEAFEKLGIVKQVHLNKDFIHYEIASAHHHHLVCIKCGLIEDFTDCDSDRIIGRALKKSRQFDKINQHNLELFGVCKSCVV